MAGRIAYYGNISTDGLVLNLDAARKDSYNRTGTTWNDISGNGNNGTLTNGPTFDSEDYGSIVFDGVDDYVNLGDVLFPSGTTDFTIDIWVNFKDSVVNDYVFSKGSAAAGIAGSTFYMVTGTNYVRFTATDSTPTRSTSVEHQGVVINQWYNFTYTYNGTTITGYRDGGNIMTNTSITGSLQYVNQPIRIGTHTYGSANPNMDVSNFKIYNRALTQDEITQNFNALRGRYGI